MINPITAAELRDQSTSDNQFLVSWSTPGYSSMGLWPSLKAAQEYIQCVRDNYPNAKIEFFECTPKELS